MIRHLLLLHLLLAIPLWGGDPPAPAWAMPEAQRQAIRDLADRVAEAAGMPDVRTGRWFRGTLHITDLSVTGEDDFQPREHDCEGIHARFPDGTWMAFLAYPIAPGKRWRIEARDMEAVEAASVFILEPDARDDLGKQILNGFAEDDATIPASWRPMLRDLTRSCAPLLICGMQYYIPRLNDALRLRPAVSLIHARIPGSEEMLCLNALVARREAAARFPHPLQDRLLLHREGAVISDFISDPAPIDVPDPLACFRSQFRSDLAQIITDERVRSRSHLPLPQALLISRIVLAGDADAERSVQRLVDGQALPVPDPAGDLAGRLRNWRCQAASAAWEWDEGHVWEDCWATIPEATRNDRQDIADRLADGFLPQDADALMNLVGDPRTSRAVDDTHPRTIGDQALRALANIWKVDPRHLIGRDDRALWNDLERTATATALQAWWVANRQRPIEDLIIAALPRLCHHDLIRCLRTWPAAQRQRLQAALAAHWRQTPADDAELDDLAAILAIAAGDDHLRPIIDAWPVDGSFHRRLLVAAWHVQQGRTGPLMTLADPLLAPRQTEPVQYRLGSLLPLLEAAPSVDLLRRLCAVCDAPFTPPAERVFLRLVGYGARHQETTPASRFLDAARHLSQPWEDGHGHPARLGTALGDAVFWHLLADRRPIPGPDADPADTRVCDRAAAQVAERAWYELDGSTLEDWSDGLDFDPTKPLAERDAALARTRAAIGALVADKLRAAGLGALTRGLGLPDAPPEPTF